MSGSPEAEEAILDEDGILVTRSRLVLPGQTYAVSLITSVRVAQKKPPLRGALLIWLVGLVLALSYPQVAIGLGVLGLALLLFPAPWVLVLHTAGGQFQALRGKRRDMQRVADALTEAMVDRSIEPERNQAKREPDTDTDQLLRLANMHRQGVLTDDEFAAMKRKLIGLSALEPS